MQHDPQNTRTATITPIDFQQICNEAVLAVDLQRWNVNAAPYELAAAVITEVHKGVCRQLTKSYEETESPPPNDERIEEIVELVSRHWTGPIMVERVINETIRIVVEHWRERHGLRVRVT